ncbi:MAG TPA: topoisomerase C-terminal repeat-containing protein, partial [Caldisericia bacterium]|nr:topoisomerase C-terminal repeat-containing protein [Caldisericia bacterium]
VGYVERDGKYLVPLPKGMKLIESLEKIPLYDLISPELTGEWEKKLLLIEKGNLKYEKFIKEIIEFTKKVVQSIVNREGKSLKDEIYEVIGKCPNCDAPLIEGEKGYFCKNFREKKCNFYIPKKLLGRKISREEVLELISNGKTKLLYNFISKNKRKFSAYLELKNGKVEITFPEDKIVNSEPIGKCPLCGGKVIETETRFRCENRNCKFSISKNILSHKIEREDVENLLKGKETEYHQFKSKGKKFNAKLSLNKDKLNFIFEVKKNGKRNS